MSQNKENDWPQIKLVSIYFTLENFYTDQKQWQTKEPHSAKF